MAYVVRRVGDDKFVSLPGSRHSYTSNLDEARTFDCRAQADHYCRSNEYVQQIFYHGAHRALSPKKGWT